MRTIKKYLRSVLALVALVLTALGVGGYILSQQETRIPFIEAAPFRLEAEFSEANAVVPGQGQTVRVAGVRIGTVAEVRLDEGRAIVAMDVEPRYSDMIRRDATALLRPRTPLKDMFVELDPGREQEPAVPEGWRIPVQNTSPTVDLDQVLAELDADNRAYLKLLVADLGRGTDGRGPDLAAFLRRFEPFHRDLARVNSAVAERRTHLRRLVRSLRLLGDEFAARPAELSSMVQSSSRVFRALASERAPLEAAVGELPSTLREASHALVRVDRMARELGPASASLVPAARRLGPASRALRPLATEGEPLLRTRLRPFVRAARPFVGQLVPVARRLARGTPELTRSMTVLNHLLNTAAFNPNGREAPGVPGRQEGNLFWVAWSTHNAISVFSHSDANGPFRRGLIQLTCSAARNLVTSQPEREFLENLTPALTDPAICGGD